MDYSIVTLDEATFRLQPVYKRVWYFKGETPDGVFFRSKEKAVIVGALINGQKLFYSWIPAVNTVTFYFFLRRFLREYPQRKFVFVLDNASYHKSSPICKFLSANHNVEVEFLPPYSPELNPIETCWKIVRKNVTESTVFPTVESMREEIEEFLDNHNFTLNVSNYLCP